MDSVGAPSIASRFVGWLVAACLSFTATGSVHILSRVAASRLAAVSISGFVPILSFSATTPEEGAQEGNALARQERVKILPPTADTATNSLSLKSANPAVNNTTLSVNDLFQQSTTPGNKLLLDGGSSKYGNMNTLKIESNNQASGLMDPGNNSSWSNAYRTLRNSVTTNPGLTTDMRADPSVTNTQAIASSTDTNNFLGGMSTTCTSVTTTTPSNTVIRSPDIRTCDRYVAPSSCSLTRSITGGGTRTRTIVSFDFLGDANFNIKLTTPTGDPIVVYDDGFGSIEPVLLALQFSHPGATVTGLRFSPHAESSVPDLSSCTYSLQAPSDLLAFDLLAPLPSSLNGNTLIFRGMSSGYFDVMNEVMHWYQTTANILETCSTVEQGPIEASPEACNLSAFCTAQPAPWTPTASLEDQVSTAAWRCTAAINSGTVNGVPIEPGTSLQLPELFPGEPKGNGFPVCFKAEARNYVCSQPAETPPDNCSAFATNPQCVRILEECLPEGMDQATGQCIFITDTYDCGTETVLDTSQNVTTTSCAGPIRCMGASCVEDDPPEVNDDFTNAAMQLNVAQWGQFDNNCATTNAGECEIFKGEGHSCKVVFGGIQNCCDKPTGVSMADYVKMTYYTYKASNREAVLKALDATGADVSGAWNGLSNWASSTYAELSQPITSAWDSLVSRGIGENLSSSVSGLTADTIAGPILRAGKQWTSDVFGPELATELWGASAELAAFKGALLGQAMSFLMAAYMYYQLVVLAIQIIYACEDAEMQLAFKKDTKSCHRLGRFCAQSILGVCFNRKDSYCCYKSPLARIVQEQVHRTTGIAWPRPSENPRCDGITVAEFQKIDWSTIDLSEWIAMLKTADMMPAGAASADVKYSADTVTRFMTQDGAVGASTQENVTDAMTGASPGNATEYVRAQLWSTLP